MRDITKLSGYPPSNVKTRLDQSNYYLASGRFPLQNAMKCINKTASCNDETCPFDEMFGLKEDPPSQE